MGLGFNQIPNLYRLLAKESSLSLQVGVGTGKPCVQHRGEGREAVLAVGGPPLYRLRAVVVLKVYLDGQVGWFFHIASSRKPAGKPDVSSLENLRRQFCRVVTPAGDDP